MFLAKVVEKIKTHVLLSVTCFRKSCLSRDNVESTVEPDRPQIIWPMHIACWIPNATNTHSDYTIVIAFALQECLNERASVLRYTFIVCLFIESLVSEVVCRDSIVGVSASSSVAAGSSS